jgi:DNA-binding IclR family transcriptional regulator
MPRQDRDTDEIGVLPTQLIGHQTGTLVKSGARVLAVLEYFYVARRPVRAIEVGRALGLPRSSANELLATMVDTGYLCFNADDKTYFPSFRIVRFGHWLSSFYFGPHELIGMMERLNDESGLPVALSVENGRHMQFVGLVRSEAPEQVRASPPDLIAEGLRVPLVGTACGSAMLMTKYDSAVAQCFARARGLRETAVPSDEMVDFIGTIRRYRQRGYATNPDWKAPDLMSLAVPLPRSASGVAMVLGFGGEGRHVQANEVELVKMLKSRVAEHFASAH